jgi:hypothetical protein
MGRMSTMIPENGLIQELDLEYSHEASRGPSRVESILKNKKSVTPHNP